MASPQVADKIVLDVATGFEYHLPAEVRLGFWEWLEQEGLKDQAVYRLEIDSEQRTAKVFAYVLNDGKRYVDPKAREPARRKPFTIQLRQLPPPALLEGVKSCP